MHVLTRPERLLLTDLLANLEHAERLLRAVAEVIDTPSDGDVSIRVEQALAKIKGAADCVFKLIHDHQ
jgi:hypothetical protein